MTPLTIRIKELRLAKGWTQARLAAAAGVTRATVNRIENRKPASIDLVVLEKLARALDVDPGFLVARAGAKGRRR